MMPKLRAKQLRNAAFYVMVVLMAALTLLPFLFMLSSSFKGSEAIRTIPIRWIPERPTLEGYIRVFNMPGFSFGRASLNSLFLALATTLVQVLSACMAAFVFAKLPFRGLGKLFGLYLATMMIPGTVTMVPNYIILRIMGLLDSYTGLILPALANAFGVFLMRQAMITVPDSYLESAMLDGASLYRVFLVILLPMVAPTFFTLVLLAFMGAWNSYLWPLIVLTSTGKQTLQVVLGNMNSMYRNNEHVLMAGAVLTILPILLVYVLSQCRVDSGIALGGLK
ncbi:MAG TPA: carbohydrate ABC transporter permease [Clostridia bacterium]|jgi:multiple sugar transport system permease protein|nr:carbohydrate ABC transporter permease [Clostridia bacterium]HPY42777.1 carbohydrate ABC transporter permease [Clostridia bacterium]HQA96852.1 carbohydrate ABC transporter permease [Clostridia bacterium]HQO55668.1 carbohydrate ABC transporter permease [Clostridia bacterium]HUM60467.1 carbohydrate ABC transporter permease [Clostridia bacterium]